jgi:hypothetical protein
MFPTPLLTASSYSPSTVVLSAGALGGKASVYVLLSYSKGLLEEQPRLVLLSMFVLYTQAPPKEIGPSVICLLGVVGSSPFRW